MPPRHSRRRARQDRPHHVPQALVKEHKLRQHPDGVRHYLVSRTQIDARSGRERAGGITTKIVVYEMGPAGRAHRTGRHGGQLIRATPRNVLIQLHAHEPTSQFHRKTAAYRQRQPNQCLNLGLWSATWVGQTIWGGGAIASVAHIRWASRLLLERS